MDATQQPQLWIIDSETGRARPLEAVIASQQAGDLTYDPDTGNVYRTVFDGGRLRWHLHSNGISNPKALASGPAVAI